MNHLMRQHVLLSVCSLLLGFVTQLGAQGVTLSTTRLNFGNQAVARNSAKSVLLTNTGDSQLIITSISQLGAPFSTTSNCPLSPALLVPHASCSITVTFSPTNAARFAGSISIAGNTAAGTRTVSLIGAGVGPVTFTPMSVIGGVKLCRWSGTRVSR
jgi:hypothetical protein